VLGERNLPFLTGYSRASCRRKIIDLEDGHISQKGGQGRLFCPEERTLRSVLRFSGAHSLFRKTSENEGPETRQRRSCNRGGLFTCGQ
jgi:hypothetical protein